MAAASPPLTAETTAAPGSRKSGQATACPGRARAHQDQPSPGHDHHNRSLHGLRGIPLIGGDVITQLTQARRNAVSDISPPAPSPRPLASDSPLIGGARSKENSRPSHHEEGARSKENTGASWG